MSVPGGQWVSVSFSFEKLGMSPGDFWHLVDVDQCITAEMNYHHISLQLFVTDFSARHKHGRYIGFRENWKLQFYPRDLVALSAQPVLVEPTHYTGQPGYVTDTEDSPSIDDDLVQKFKGDTGELSSAKPAISVRNTEL